jgi:hypothetical protein
MPFPRSHGDSEHLQNTPVPQGRIARMQFSELVAAEHERRVHGGLIVSPLQHEWTAHRSEHDSNKMKTGVITCNHLTTLI